MNDLPAFGALNYTVLSVYLAAMLGIGLIVARRQKNTEAYFLAGRNMPWLIVAMSIFASLTSAVSYMSVPGRAYEENISLLAGFMLGPVVALLLLRFFYSFYHRMHVTTVYEYIEHRYGRGGRYTASSLFILARLGWLGLVIYAPALALSAATGLHLTACILLMGLLATAYTVLGGLSAVIWTDVVQFVILVGGAVWVGLSLIHHVPDGLAGIMATAAEHGRSTFDWRLDITKMTASAAVIGFFFALMQDYGTDQVTAQRVLAIRSFRGKCAAMLLNSVFDLLIVGTLLFVGLGLFAYYRSFPDAGLANIKSDQLLAYYIVHEMPPGVSGLIISAIFAAAMSSMDSGLHSVSTVLTHDFIRPLRRRERSDAGSDRADLLTARLLVLGLGLVAIVVALVISRSEGFEHLLDTSQSILSLLTAPILALFLLGVLTRRANTWGWVVGAVAAACLSDFLKDRYDVHWLYYFPISLLSCFVVGYVLSALLVSLGLVPLADPAATLWAAPRGGDEASGPAAE